MLAGDCFCEEEEEEEEWQTGAYDPAVLAAAARATTTTSTISSSSFSSSSSLPAAAPCPSQTRLLLKKKSCTPPVVVVRTTQQCPSPSLSPIPTIRSWAHAVGVVDAHPFLLLPQETLPPPSPPPTSPVPTPSAPAAPSNNSSSSRKRKAPDRLLHLLPPNPITRLALPPPLPPPPPSPPTVTPSSLSSSAPYPINSNSIGGGGAAAAAHVLTPPPPRTTGFWCSSLQEVSQRLWWPAAAAASSSSSSPPRWASSSWWRASLITQTTPRPPPISITTATITAAAAAAPSSLRRKGGGKRTAATKKQKKQQRRVVEEETGDDADNSLPPPPPPPPPVEPEREEDEKCEEGEEEDNTGNKNRRRRRRTKAAAAREGGWLIRARKIAVKKSALDPGVRELFNRLFGIYRHIYNEAVELDARNDYSPDDMTRVRSLLTKKENFMAEKPWKNKLPKHAKQQAVEEFFRGKKAALANGTYKGRMHKKLRRRMRQEVFPWESYRVCSPTSIELPRKDVKIVLSLKEPLPQCVLEAGANRTLVKDELKLMRTRAGKMYVILTTKAYPVQAPKEHGAVALDPGVRNFLALYSPTGVAGTIGEVPQDNKEAWHIGRLCRRMDRLISLTAPSKQGELHGSTPEEKRRKRRKLKHKLHALIERVRNTIDDAHRKTARWLCATFSTVLLPEYRSSTMLPDLHAKAARAMATWAFYRFKLRLKATAERWGTRVLDVTEEYTSKTCGRCGKINPSLGADRVFRCDACGLEMHRDVHAARNIYLKNMHLLLNNDDGAVAAVSACA